MLRKIVSTVALVFAGAIVHPQQAVAEEGKKELVVLVLVDALRADHVGAYGYEKPTTPNFDALAQEGTRYTRAYVNAPWTSPSTASFLTGLNASRHRTETDKSKLPKSITTLAQRLQRAGFATAGFSANGNGGSMRGLQRGFDLFEDPSDYPRKQRGKTYCCNGLPTGQFLNQRIMRYLDKNDHDKQFLFVFYVDPHDPYGAPPELEKMFLGKDFKGKPRRKALWEYDNNYSERDRQSLVALYDAGIRNADQAFGDLTAYLKKSGRYDDATIIVSADHGEGFGEHDFYLHAHHFWDEVTHVPLIAKGPQFAAGKVDRRLTQSIDVAPTIAELTNASSSSLMGVSLLAPTGANHVISEYNEYGIHRQAIIGERYKVIWQRPADEAWYLRAAKHKKYFPSVSFDKEVVRVFDLQADPAEKIDLAGTMPEAAAQQLAQLRAFVAESERLADDANGS